MLRCVLCQLLASRRVEEGPLDVKCFVISHRLFLFNNTSRSSINELCSLLDTVLRRGRGLTAQFCIAQGLRATELSLTKVVMETATGDLL